MLMVAVSAVAATTAKIANMVSVKLRRWYQSTHEFVFLVHCPFGPSWLAVPVEHYTRNQQLTECSDMVSSSFREMKLHI